MDFGYYYYGYKEKGRWQLAVHTDTYSKCALAEGWEGGGTDALRPNKSAFSGLFTLAGGCGHWHGFPSLRPLSRGQSKWHRSWQTDEWSVACEWVILSMKTEASKGTDDGRSKGRRQWQWHFCWHFRCSLDGQSDARSGKCTRWHYLHYSWNSGGERVMLEVIAFAVILVFRRQLRSLRRTLEGTKTTALEDRLRLTEGWLRNESQQQSYIDEDERGWGSRQDCLLSSLTRRLPRWNAWSSVLNCQGRKCIFREVTNSLPL